MVLIREYFPTRKSPLAANDVTTFISMVTDAIRDDTSWAIISINRSLNKRITLKKFRITITVN